MKKLILLLFSFLFLVSCGRNTYEVINKTSAVLDATTYALNGNRYYTGYYRTSGYYRPTIQRRYPYNQYYNRVPQHVRYTSLHDGNIYCRSYCPGITAHFFEPVQALQEQNFFVEYIYNNRSYFYPTYWNGHTYKTNFSRMARIENRSQVSVQATHYHKPFFYRRSRQIQNPCNHYCR